MNNQLTELQNDLARIRQQAKGFRACADALDLETQKVKKSILEIGRLYKNGRSFQDDDLMITIVDIDATYYPDAAYLCEIRSEEGEKWQDVMKEEVIMKLII